MTRRLFALNCLLIFGFLWLADVGIDRRPLTTEQAHHRAVERHREELRRQLQAEVDRQKAAESRAEWAAWWANLGREKAERACEMEALQSHSARRYYQLCMEAKGYEL